MYHIPSELRYTSSHEWVRLEGENEAVMGMTSHAQRLLGDMVFVDLPIPGNIVLAGEDSAGPTHDRYLHKLIKSRSVEWLQARF